MFSRATILILGLGMFSATIGHWLAPPQELGSAQVIETQPAPQSVEERFPFSLTKGSTLYSVLLKLNVAPQVIQQIVTGAKPVVDLRRLKPGTRFQLVYLPGAGADLSEIKFWFSPTDQVDVRKSNQDWIAEKIDISVTTKITTFSGTVESTLWESAEKASMDPILISDLAEIFAWKVDFAREVRTGDRWRLSVEQRFVNDEAIGWGAIIAAEYVNQGEVHSAALFRKDGKVLGYFAPDGSMLKRMFLKSPIQYARISSRFTGQRFHPILKINRPHNGVDYAAPRGTPVRAVGQGVVTFVGWQGGGGKTIKIRHNSIYETAYKHLNGYATGIRSGARVNQGQVIGFVGSTGLSTAPHLHFEFFKNRRYVDPLRQVFPSADPVPAQFMAEFRQEALKLVSSLPAWDATEISQHNSASTGTPVQN